MNILFITNCLCLYSGTVRRTVSVFGYFPLYKIFNKKYIIDDKYYF